MNDGPLALAAWATRLQAHAASLAPVRFLVYGALALGWWKLGAGAAGGAGRTAVGMALTVLLLELGIWTTRGARA